MKLNLILEVKSQEMDKIFSESELLEFLKERLTIGKIDNIKILSAGVINAITVGRMQIFRIILLNVCTKMEFIIFTTAKIRIHFNLTICSINILSAENVKNFCTVP